ncbi:MAG: hypothetical protein M3463_17030, partial [Verrucomicrobiota bacterium]|nr:hypothetical protein [Verrucomicrobiota bacterium]
MRAPLRASIAVSVLAFFAPVAAAAEPPPQPVDFALDVAPIFEAHCVRCHNAKERKGKFSLASAADLFAERKGHEVAVVPGDADGSLLVELITPAHAGEEPEMPEEGKPLTTGQIALVRRWIAEGAKWPDGVIIHSKPKANKATWWALQPLRPIAPPEVEGAPPEWTHAP